MANLIVLPFLVHLPLTFVQPSPFSRLVTVPGSEVGLRSFA